MLSILSAGVLLYIVIYYNVFKGARCKSCTTLEGKTAIVTGCSSGIGKATALDLAKKGARVVMACRNKEKAEGAVYDIRQKSGNNKVVFMQLDLGSLKSVRSFADTFLKTEPRLDLLINNAGMMGPGRTEDGFGMAFGVNYLGHFLLTNLLLEKLKQCSHSRVVNVSALLHCFGTIDFSLLVTHKDLVTCQSNWHNFKAYCNSKLCNILFTMELANLLEGTSVTCYSLHPGVIDTNLCQNMKLWQQLFIKCLSKIFFMNTEEGSQTTLYCALQEGIEAFSGRYFVSCALQELGIKGRNDVLARKLWEISERFTGLT